MYKNQRTVSRTLEEISRVLSVPREVLHLTSTGKGLVAGALFYVTHDNVKVDVSQAENGKVAQVI